MDSLVKSTKEKHLSFVLKTSQKNVIKNNDKNGDAGYQSPYLSHAKRALYHLSYIPILLKFIL